MQRSLVIVFSCDCFDCDGSLQIGEEMICNFEDYSIFLRKPASRKTNLYTTKLFSQWQFVGKT